MLKEINFPPPAERHAVAELMLEAQQLAFAPVSFMICICMHRMGVWQVLTEAIGDGISVAETAEKCKISPYAASLLLESSLATGAVNRKEDRFHLTRLGHVLARDTLTKINFEFIYEVCFKGLFHLEEALRDGKPAGLKELGDWSTVYEGLSSLPKSAQQAWLAFDHHYSDSAFHAAMPFVLEEGAGKLLDIGGNTGRFTRCCLRASDQIKVTIADLPQQIAMAQSQLGSELGADRVSYHPCDLLQKDAFLPTGFTVVWMSQFLVCFDEAQVLSILRLACSALTPSGRVLILDTFWDRQSSAAASFSLLQTSPYFTAIANGCSKMYESRVIIGLAAKAGLILERAIDELGISHSLLIL
ncbi:MAG: methyltransferase [Proteobacteria bacterium]|nr:methyltransferase [Pseudomonadota bacterium]